jgi:hypothetical protein
MLNVRDICDYVTNSNKLIGELYPEGVLPRRRDARMFELDFKEMFPKLPRDKVATAVKEVYTIVYEALQNYGAEGLGNMTSGRPIRATKKGLWFCIHKTHRAHDRLGKAYGSDFQEVSIEDVWRFVDYDLYHNDAFQVGNRIYRQKRGIAIGGVISAQLAELYCILCEYKWLKQPHQEQLKTLSKHNLTHAIPTPPYRFRDNVVGLCITRVSLDRIQQWLEDLYEIELQQEGEGRELQSLETMLRVDRRTGMIGMRMKMKVDWTVREGRRLKRFPDRFAVGARTQLKSIVSALAYKCTYYATTLEDLAHNKEQVCLEMRVKGYPTQWWQPTLRKIIRKESTHLLCSR